MNHYTTIHTDTIDGFDIVFSSAAEREACAQIAWNYESEENGPIESAIRARSEV